MIKKLIRKNPALTIYLLVNLLIIAYLFSIFIFKVFSTEPLTCQYRGFGSGARQACGAVEYFRDNAFWGVLEIILIQIIWLPASLITYIISYFIQKGIKSKYNERLWYKYGLVLFVYLIIFLIFFLKDKI